MQCPECKARQGFYDAAKPMSADTPSDRPSDDELPPDPFPGDPFDALANDGPVSAKPSGPTGTADLAGLLGSLGPMGPLFQQLAAMQNQSGGLNWDVTRQIAVWTASGQQVESPPDPVERIKMEQLVGRVEREVSTAAGLDVSEGHLVVVVTTRAGWASQSLEDYRQLLDRLAATLSATKPPTDGPETDDRDPMSAVMGMIAPMIVSSQAGAMVGELAKTSLGSYDLPVPRSSPKDQLLFVLRNIDEFATEWSVPVEHARTHVAIVETAMHSVLRIPHVRSLLVSYVDRFVGSYVIDPDAIGEQLQDQLESFGADGLPDLADAGALFGVAETAEQTAVRSDISRVLAPIVGFVDYVAAVTGARMLGDNRKVVEAWRRRRLSADHGKTTAAQMLGLSVDDELLELGATFIGGVIQRKGPEALLTLWSKVEHLPTRSELAAPGLWLARVGLAE